MGWECGLGYRGRIAILACLALGGCATPIQTGSQCTVEPGAFDDEQTFTWHSEPAVALDDQTGFVSPLVVKALEARVIEELSRKGFKFVERRETDVDDQWSDLEVSLTLKTRREIICMSADGFQCGRGDCRDCVDFNFPASMETRSVGFLAADIFYLGSPVWRGWVERDLFVGDRNNTDAVINEAVPVLFGTFPP